eukprot:6489266-Lingulodinium_polyedra.AAC.1
MGGHPSPPAGSVLSRFLFEVWSCVDVRRCSTARDRSGSSAVGSSLSVCIVASCAKTRAEPKAIESYIGA